MRLFVGLELGDEARAALLAARVSWEKTVRARFYEADRYHLTLAFLGETDPERAPLLERTLRRARWKPFAVEPGEAGCFPGGVLYFGVKGPCPGLLAAREAVAAALREDGWPFDGKPFRPHITLARGARGPGEPPSCPPWRQEVRRITLFESARRETGQGSRLFYTPIFRAEAPE